MKINSKKLLSFSIARALTICLVMSLFLYTLPQYRIIPLISIETFGLGALIVLASCIYIADSGRVNKGILLFGLILTIVNIFSQLMSPFPPTAQFYKILFLGICFVFITDYFVRINPIMQSALKAHIALTLILFLYGSYIYIVGDIEGTQTTDEGWKSVGRYWGFRYTVSTRNDDLFYIVPSCLILLNYALFSNSRAVKILSYAMFFMLTIAIFLSFSRGHILSMFIAAITCVLLKMQSPIFINGKWVYKNRYKAYFKIVFALIGVIFLGILSISILAIYIPEFNILLNLGLKLLSIVNPEAQSEALNMTSSNAARINIYFIGFDLMSKYPLGVGAENFQYASMAEGHGRYWGENTYLEYLVGFGIFGGLIIPMLLVYPVIKLYYMYKKNQGFLNLTYLTVSFYIAIAALFNVLIGNLYFYIWLATIYSHIIYQKRQKKLLNNA
ncbi:O-antigen ligase family protein [Gammaproteobacteria bacterium]|nr:O-antigen ligase family protein [Gammaproteobacteria bacterium]|tara:strand:+ start:15166 stop:16497 length:1332 start_codon:yes stop_codon:yes gene_type:complete